MKYIDNSPKASKAILFCTEYGFDRFFLALPHGYDTLIGEDGINLSGGQSRYWLLPVRSGENLNYFLSMKAPLQWMAIRSGL